MANNANTGNLLGTQVEVPKGPGSFIGKRFRALVTAALNCVFNWKFLIPYYDSRGNYLGTKEAKTVMGPKGPVTTFPAMGGAAGSSGSVPFSGAGAPSVSTLAASSYVAGPVPSLYVDLTNKILYVCTTAGTASTSVWSQISSSGGTFADFWDHTVAYAAGSVIQVTTVTTYNSITILPGTYVLRQGLSTPANPTGNQIPQYPYPLSGTIYWICIAMGISVASTCGAGGSGTVYINSSGPF